MNDHLHKQIVEAIMDDAGDRGLLNGVDNDILFDIRAKWEDLAQTIISEWMRDNQ